ncbi:MAG TPA: hypothetical protein VGP53_03590, partial [Acidimicrobiales bacterium]|nr:hypothetical protein [Acidimicrobiales bacterium]
LGLAEREMTQATAEREQLVAELSAGDHTTLTQTAHALADAEARLAVAEDRWLALSEELGG